MFESLDEQMKIDEKKMVSAKERALRWALIALVSVVVFGGLYYGINLMQGS